MAIRSVKDIIEVKLLNHLFKFKRLTWEEYLSLGFQIDRKMVLCKALKEVSGKSVTLEDATKIITSIPTAISDRVYTIFIGSQDDRRKFTAPPLWQAPNAVEHVTRLQKEEVDKDKIISEVEKQLETKFGKEALEEEREINRRIVQNSGYKGAIKLAQETVAHLDQGETL